MIKSKDEYRFVSQDALKRITINGSPYPVRSSKLVTTGEDFAFLSESKAERESLVFEEKILDKPILVVQRNIDKQLGSEELMGMFYDAKKIKKLPHDKKILSVRIDTTYDPEQGGMIEEHIERNRKARERYEKAKEETSAKISILYKDLNELIEGVHDSEGKIIKPGLKDKAKKEIEELQDKWYKERIEIIEDRDRKIEKITANAKSKRKSLDKKYENDINDINRRMSKETDPNGLAKLSIEIEKVKADYDIGLEDIENDKYKNINEARKNCEYEIEIGNNELEDNEIEISNKLETDISKATEKVEKKQKDLEYKLDDVYKETWTGGEFNYKRIHEYKQYNEMLEDAKIKKSCAEKFYSRPLCFTMSSTATNRIFADYERMVIYSQGGLHRRPCMFKWPEGKGIYSDIKQNNVNFHSEYHQQKTQSSYLEVLTETGPCQISGTEYGMYIGKRLNHDIITSIEADVLIARTEDENVVLSTKSWPRGTWAANTYFAQSTIALYEEKEKEIHQELFISKGTKTGRRVKF